MAGIVPSQNGLEVGVVVCFLRKTFGAGDRVRAEPFDAIEFDLGLLWELIPEEPEEVES